MSGNYLLADFAVSFNNCIQKRLGHFHIFTARMTLDIVIQMKKRRYIHHVGYDICPHTRRSRLKILPKYHETKPFIKKIELVTKPSLRVYWTASEMSRRFFRNNFQGLYVVSTSKGIIFSDDLFEDHAFGLGRVSGEVLLKLNL